MKAYGAYKNREDRSDKKNMKKNLYISDLDGTLLDNNAKLSPKAREIIVELLKRGVLFSVATARSIHSVKKILGEMPFQLPIVLSNGGYVSEYEKEKTMATHDICPEAARAIEEWIEEKKIHPIFSCLDAGRPTLLYRQVQSEGMGWYLETLKKEERKARLFHHIGEIDGFERMAYTFMDRQPIIEEIHSALSELMGDRVRFQKYENEYSKGWYWLSIHGKEATKAQGILKMIAASQVTYDKLIVFGDHLNDKEMFEMADEAYAVENAEEELKALATAVISSNEQNGVPLFIRDRVDKDECR